MPQACKFALRMCGPSMGCEGLCDMFLNHLREDRSLHYGEFMNDVCKHLVRAGGSRGLCCSSGSTRGRSPAAQGCSWAGLSLPRSSGWLGGGGGRGCASRARLPRRLLLSQMQSYPEMLNRLIVTNLFYFKSSWVDIRAAAPMFIGKTALPGGVPSPDGCVTCPCCPGSAAGPCSAGRALLGVLCGQVGVLEWSVIWRLRVLLSTH